MKKVVKEINTIVAAPLDEIGDDQKYLTLAGLKIYKQKYDEKLGNTITNSTARLFESEKTELQKADSDVISEYFEAHHDTTPRQGDVFVITTKLEEKEYEKSSYYYSVNKWVAITGNVDASKVILRENIKLAGNYTQVGNVTKGQNETKDLEVKGKSLKEVMQSIFTAKLQPGNPTQPAIQGFALNGAKAVEAGTKLDSVTTNKATLTAGSYQFGPETGVIAQSWKIERVTNIEGLNKQVATADTVTDNNDGKGFIIGDQGGDNVVNSLQYKITAHHNTGAIAHDNLGENSSPEKKIEEGDKVATSSAYTPFRQYFYGATTTEDLHETAVDSAYIRALTNSGKAYAKGDFMLNVKPGNTRVVIACIATVPGVTKVINTDALNADVTGTFKKSTVKVAGANDYHPVDYNVWTFEPAEAYGQKADLKVTLG